MRAMCTAGLIAFSASAMYQGRIADSACQRSMKPEHTLFRATIVPALFVLMPGSLPLAPGGWRDDYGFTVRAIS